MTSRELFDRLQNAKIDDVAETGAVLSQLIENVILLEHQVRQLQEELERTDRATRFMLSRV
jgi:hypothetical protein